MIKFVREYQKHGYTFMDIIYENRVRTICTAEIEIPKTVKRFIEKATYTIQMDRWHGEEKIWEV